MKLTPESAAVVVRRVHPDVCESLAGHIEGEIGGEISDLQYDKLSVAVEEKLMEVVGGLEFDAP